MQIGKPVPPVSHIAQAYPDHVEVRGRDLCGDLMGRVTFTEYFCLLLTGREPTADQRDFLDLLLVAIAEHGMMPTNVTARITLAADPGSLQGAVAAGILGAGPVILGTSEACGRLLASMPAGTVLIWDAIYCPSDYHRLPLDILVADTAYRRLDLPIPGFSVLRKRDFPDYVVMEKLAATPVPEIEPPAYPPEIVAPAEPRGRYYIERSASRHPSRMP